MIRNKKLYENYLNMVNKTLSYFKSEDLISSSIPKYKVVLNKKDMDQAFNVLKSKKKVKRFKTNFRVENLSKSHKNFLEILCSPMDLSGELVENMPHLIDFTFEDLYRLFQKIDRHPIIKALYKGIYLYLYRNS